MLYLSQHCLTLQDNYISEKMKEKDHEILKLSLDYNEREKDLKQYKKEIATQQTESDQLNVQVSQRDAN